MLTLGKIQLRGFFTIHIEDAEELLSRGYPDYNDSQRGMRQSLLMFDAYMTLTGFHPQSMNLEEFAGFRGFLNVVLELPEDNIKYITSQLFEFFADVGVLPEKQVSLILKESQPWCDEKYLEREPIKCQFLNYQSLFPSKEPGSVICVDFASIAHMLNNSSLNYLSSLLSPYFSSLTTQQAETDAQLIIALAQGLLYQHPGVDLGDIHLSAAESTEFIAGARYSAEWQMHNAGYFRGDAAENWKYVSAVIVNFFVANNILSLNKAGRRLLAPY